MDFMTTIRHILRSWVTAPALQKFTAPRVHSLVRFENKNIFYYYEKCSNLLNAGVVFVYSIVVGLGPSVSEDPVYSQPVHKSTLPPKITFPGISFAGSEWMQPRGEPFSSTSLKTEKVSFRARETSKKSFYDRRSWTSQSQGCQIFLVTIFIPKRGKIYLMAIQNSKWP
jgi:hypothetical protein